MLAALTSRADAVSRRRNTYDIQGDAEGAGYAQPGEEKDVCVRGESSCCLPVLNGGLQGRQSQTHLVA